MFGRRLESALFLVLLASIWGCNCEETIDKVTGKIVLDTGVLDFGTTCVGDRLLGSVTVTNEGPVPLDLDNITVSGSAAFEIVNAPERLGSAQGSDPSSGTIELAFTPTAAGTAFADLVIESSDQENPQVQVRLNGEGDDGDRVNLGFLCEGADGTTLEDCPSVFNFPMTAIGATSELPIVLENRGCAFLTATGVAVTDQTPDDAFSVTGPTPEFGFSGSQPRTIVPAFAPNTDNTWVGKLRVAFADRGNGSDGTCPASCPTLTGGTDCECVFNMVGTGIDVRLRVTPETYNFGGAAVGSPQTQTFTIINDGAAPGEIETIELRDASTEFTITPSATLPATIAGAGTFDFDVTYGPEDAGRDENAIVVTTNVGVLPEVPVAGGASPQLEVNPPSNLDFGTVATGAVATETVTVKNIGAAELNVSNIELRVNTNDFALDKLPTFPATLAQGDSFTFDVIFTDNPGIGKDKNGAGASEVAELVIYSDDPSYENADPAGGYVVLIQTDTQANFKPTAVLVTSISSVPCTVEPCGVTVNNPATFDVSGSTDPENDTLSFVWEVTSMPTGGTATVATTTGDGSTAELTPDFPGSWTVKVTATDPFGNSDFATVDLGVSP